MHGAAKNLHRDPFGDTATNVVTGRSPAKVVQGAPGDTRTGAGCTPRRIEVANTLSGVVEDVHHNAAAFTFHGGGGLAPRFQGVEWIGGQILNPVMNSGKRYGVMP